jgi:glycosyltransferase involved in cell wall biosynthesis
MKPAISVIICTHNPRYNYLDKVLAALKSQTLQFEQWELLLIDNASEKLLSSEIHISWHPQSRHIREKQLGLTPARLRGIREAKAETLIFVDDDNVLDSDYLEVALRISKDYPFIGAWGGQIRPNFEVTPPDWTKPYWQWLAIREFEQDKWSNLVNQYETTPCGAGLCVRKIVAEEYAELLHRNPKRLSLGRNGKLLLSGEDSDLAFTACDIGLGTGHFTSLKLTHLIPASRLEEEYLIKLMEGMVYSHIILHYFRGETPQHLPSSWRSKLYQYYRTWRMNFRERRFYKAQQRGMFLAMETISKLANNPETMI